MKRTRIILLCQFYLAIIITLAMVILFETGLLEEGVMVAEENKPIEFTILSMMTLVTLVNIPLALRLFKFNFVSSTIKGSPRKLLIFGTIRLCLLTMPLIIDTFLYYLFITSAFGFGYMPVIVALAMVFVYPTEKRCKNEIGNFEFGKV